MKKTLILAIAALALPSVALAAKPSHSSASAPKVSYILKGTLTNYVAYNPVGPVNGTVTITVTSANYHGKALKGLSLTFAVDANTAVTLPTAGWKNTDTGIVKIRALKKIAPAVLAATLQLSPAKQIVDQGTKHHGKP